MAAIYQGLKIAIVYGDEKVELEFDSLETVTHLCLSKELPAFLSLPRLGDYISTIFVRP